MLYLHTESVCCIRIQYTNNHILMAENNLRYIYSNPIWTSKCLSTSRRSNRLTGNSVIVSIEPIRITRILIEDGLCLLM